MLFVLVGSEVLLHQAVSYFLDNIKCKVQRRGEVYRVVLGLAEHTQQVLDLLAHHVHVLLDLCGAVRR